MKKTIFALALISALAIQKTKAQLTTLADQRNVLAFLENAERIGSNNTLYLPDDVVGSPYSNPIFLLGDIYEQNKVIASNYALRYNAFKDEIEVKEDLYVEDIDTKILTKNPEVYVKIMDNMFVFRDAVEESNDAGYYQILHVGKVHSLYKKTAKKYYPAKKAQNSFEKDVLATFVDRPTYYLVSKEGDFQKFGSSKKKILKLFQDKQPELKEMIKSRKLDVTEEEDLLKLVKYYDAISLVQ
jgi:hypothetical protein